MYVIDVYDSASMCEYMYSVLRMHIDRQAITPLGARRGTLVGWESRPRNYPRILL